MTHMSQVVGSIPSPSSGSFNLGPLNIHAYGLMIALGVVAGVWLMGRRFEQRGFRHDVSAGAPICRWLPSTSSS